MKAYISYEGIQRVERFLFPPAALREALLNVLVHRDYSMGVPIQIRVYEDRIRFSNDGQLPDGWTVERLLPSHQSKPHNPLSAGAFFRSGDIESWGRGIDKIRTACREHGSDFPVFNADPTSMTVEFLGVVPGNIASTDQPGLVDGLADSQLTIIGLVRRDPEISKREMAKRIGIRTTAIDKNIAALKWKAILIEATYEQMKSFYPHQDEDLLTGAHPNTVCGTYDAIEAKFDILTNARKRETLDLSPRTQAIGFWEDCFESVRPGIGALGRFARFSPEPG